MKFDIELAAAGFTVDLASPSFLIINTCAITGKAEREAKQLVYQLRKKHPEAKIVITGCSGTLWSKYKTSEEQLADIIVPNDKKSSLVAHLLAGYDGPLATASVAKATGDKFRHSNRLLVKIQDGCHRFCAYCIVPYLRGQPQSQKTADIIRYIQSIQPLPSEVSLSAINTESFGKDTGETLMQLLQATLQLTKVPRIALGSLHPWSLTREFLAYYGSTLSREARFVQFFHVPIQSGSPHILKLMRREYEIDTIAKNLISLKNANPFALIATDVIVGYLGETDELFEETYQFLKHSPINRFHVFRFSNRPHTAAFYLKKNMSEPSAEKKKERSQKLIDLSKKKYKQFTESLIGTSCTALVIAREKAGFKILLDNNVEGIIQDKDCLPGQIAHVTIINAKNGIAFCKES